MIMMILSTGEAFLAWNQYVMECSGGDIPIHIKHNYHPHQPGQIGRQNQPCLSGL